MTGEDELLRWLRRRSAERGGSLIGDDAAILPRAETWAVTVDGQIENTHFRSGLDPAIVARRLLEVNLSDLAAMGAEPAHGLLALAAPEGFDHRRFLRAFEDACKKRGVGLVGGDLARNDRLTAFLTLFGRRAPGGRWVERAGARPGQDLWVGGTLGESAAGALLIDRGARIEKRSVFLPESFEAVPQRLERAARRAVRRHLEPRAQLELGRWLASIDCGGALDVSDGLARDLHRMCEESSCGAEVELDRLPHAENFESLARELESESESLALAGGEDYVLLFTLETGVEPPARLGCRRIGRTIEDRHVYQIRGGRRRRLAPLGWDHLSSA